jgi:hypothetical protein
MENREPVRTHTVTILMLPHFHYALPVLDGPKGLHYLPISALCRLLGLNATDELRRLRHVLLGSSACLLPLPRGASRASAQHEVVAWCLPYPLAVGQWFWQVSRRVRDPARRAQLDQAVDDIMELSERAEDLVRARYQAGRTAMHALARDLARVERLIHVLVARASAQGAAVRTRVDAVALRHRSPLEQAGTFVQDWLRRQADQPIVDAIRIDEAGNVVDDSVPFPLFATFGEEDERLLRHFWHLLDDVITELDALARELPGPED